MHMINAVLSARPVSANNALSAGVAIDLLWNSALPEDRLEHIYSQNCHDRLEFVFFIRGKPLVHAHDTVTAICRRALDTAPALRGWHLIPADARPAGPPPPTRRTLP